MSARHTPAPWAVGDLRRDHLVVQHFDQTPGAISGTLALVTARPTWKDEAEANACLIAAAPDLLWAVKELREEVNFDCSELYPDQFEALLQKVDAIIAKAEGRS